MNNEQKMKRLLEMQEHPECYTEEEIRQLMADEECRQMYDQMVRAADAMFAEKHQSHALPKRRSRGWMQIAAAFIGVLMLSGIAYATIHIVSNSRLQQAEAQDTTAVTHKVSDPAVRQTSHESQILCEPKTFENTPLKDIAAELASVYHITIEVKNTETATLRLYYPWNPQMPLKQVVEELNRFEKVHLTLTNDTLIIE